MVCTAYTSSQYGASFLRAIAEQSLVSGSRPFGAAVFLTRPTYFKKLTSVTIIGYRYVMYSLCR